MTTVYLLHFEKPYFHAQHYIGATDDLPRRLHEHRSGNGANIVHVFARHGISFVLARTWDADGRGYALERHLKHHYKNARALCPICNPDGHGGDFPQFISSPTSQVPSLASQVSSLKSQAPGGPHA